MADQGIGTADAVAFIPAVPHLNIDPHGYHSLSGTRCRACGTVVEGNRLACQCCGDRDSIEPTELGTKGAVYAHTVVHRSFPGVKTPFVAVVVDLDGGGTVRGTLTDVDPLAALPERVDMVFRDTGQRDPEGRPFLSYFFIPAGGASA